jgi:hypothetical protein
LSSARRCCKALQIGSRGDQVGGVGRRRHGSGLLGRVYRRVELPLIVELPRLCQRVVGRAGGHNGDESQ